MDRQECLSYERIRTKGDTAGERPYEAGQRPFHVTQDGKGKPVMELFA